MKPDPWDMLRELTPARVALGRAGGSLPTGEVLRFAADHAAARDAVRAELDTEQLAVELAPCGLSVIHVQTRADSRDTYLKRPDLGRQLTDQSIARLAAARGEGCDVALIAADGLSALACARQAPAVLAALVPMLRDDGLRIGPIAVARQARVAVQDCVGSALGARVAVILIGERPGLGTPDSLGAYLVYDPQPGRNDADRNCVSNIRPAGMPPTIAAKTLRYLIGQSLARRLSGVELKDDRKLIATGGPTTSPPNLAESHRLL
jgi:ethanolamine ammonia-lyase small subunit